MTEDGDELVPKLQLRMLILKSLVSPNFGLDQRALEGQTLGRLEKREPSKEVLAVRPPLFPSIADNGNFFTVTELQVERNFVSLALQP